MVYTDHIVGVHQSPMVYLVVSIPLKSRYSTNLSGVDPILTPFRNILTNPLTKLKVVMYTQISIIIIKYRSN